MHVYIHVPGVILHPCGSSYVIRTCTHELDLLRTYSKSTCAHDYWSGIHFLQVGEYLYSMNGQPVLNASHTNAACIILMGSSIASLAFYWQRQTCRFHIRSSCTISFLVRELECSQDCTLSIFWICMQDVHNKCVQVTLVSYFVFCHHWANNKISYLPCLQKQDDYHTYLVEDRAVQTKETFALSYRFPTWLKSKLSSCASN